MNKLSNVVSRFDELDEETTKEVLRALKEPFDVDDIDWKPQNVKKDKALALAFADPRVYIDRLNEVVGPLNWSRQFMFSTTPYTKIIKGKAPWGSPIGTPVPPDVILSGNKVMCIAYVTVLGITHSSTGESDASDDNAATSSEAQAFKRACIAFGLGRYLYDLPKVEAPYSYGKFTIKPELPDWAVPKITCDGCAENIQPIEHNGHKYSVSWLVNNSKTKYDARLCSNCQKARAGANATRTVGSVGAK
jgi:hypothetical protein